MPRFVPSLQVPGLAVKPPAVTPPTPPVIGSTNDALTLDALMARQKAAAARQGATMQEGAQNIPQGLGQLGWTLVNALQQRAAEKEYATGQREVADAFGKIDWNTGQLPPDAIQAVMARDPETGMELYKTAMALRAAGGKQEQWSPIPTPQGETGQWFQNQYGDTKKVGGGTEGTAPKLGDIGSIQTRVSNLDSYKNMAQATPIWSSIVDSTKRNTPQADLNLVIGMAKLFDPTSVVRSGETETIQQTSDLPSNIWAAWQYLSGEPGSRLKDDVRAGLLQEGFSRMTGYNDAWLRDRKQLEGFAQRHQLDPRDLLLDSFPELAPLGGQNPPPPDENTPPDENQPVLTPAQQRGDEPYLNPDGSPNFSRMSDAQFAAWDAKRQGGGGGQ